MRFAVIYRSMMKRSHKPPAWRCASSLSVAGVICSLCRPSATLLPSEEILKTLIMATRRSDSTGEYCRSITPTPPSLCYVLFAAILLHAIGEIFPLLFIVAPVLKSIVGRYIGVIIPTVMNWVEFLFCA